ncbi:MAG: Type III pantothenate kinase [Tenericutes bacterium ADurb.Bin087]|nr:MAG: Type III pantothenate kinase [Tenericutes bacterium ADurb.Bin087]
MQLTVDIGNSVISIALFADDKIVDVYATNTPKELHDNAPDNFAVVRPIIAAFKDHFKDVQHYEKAIISSVVPKLNYPMAYVIKAELGVEPQLIFPNHKTSVTLDVERPETVGTDIIACAVGAYKFGEGPFIVIDLGTANKYFYVDDKHVFHGVAISPGVEVSLKGLVNNAAQLFDVPITLPAKVLGRNTIDALNSGLLYGLLSEMNGFIELIKNEVGGNPKVLLTGGNATHIKEVVPLTIKYVPFLVHYGLYDILVKSDEK